MEKGFCIAHILDIVSACEVWFTFVFRAHEHRAVEDFVVKVLHDSRGSRRFTFALLPSFTSLLYHNLDDLSRGNFNFFHSSVMGLEPLDSAASLQPRLSFPLDIIIITYLYPKVKYFSKKFLSQHLLTWRPGKKDLAQSLASSQALVLFAQVEILNFLQ